MFADNISSISVICVSIEMTINSSVWLQQVERRPSLMASLLRELCSRSARRVERAISQAAAAVARNDPTHCTVTGSGAAVVITRSTATGS